MTRQAFEKELYTALHETSASDKALQETITHARAAVVQQGNVERIGFAAFLRRQVRFIGWKIWLMQALCLLFANGMLNHTFGTVYFTYPRLMMQCLCCLSVLVMLTALPFLYEAVRCRMHEVEAATRFSATRLLAAKLILIGAGDLVMMAGLWLFAYMLTPLDAQLILLCLILPFLLAASGCLTLLDRLTPTHFCSGSILWAALVCLAFSLISRQALTLSVFFWPGLALCFVLIGYCLCTLRRLICMNHFCELQLS